jgi:uncharacterized phage protein (TIGR01671 family)
MREIKFRAWILGEGERFKNYIRVIPETKMIYDFLVINQDGMEKYDLESCDKIEIMQFTGLKDKNGKEIYEGDVVKVLGTIGLIYWDNYYCSFLVECESISPNQSIKQYEDLEVIGNKFENPELLK